MQWRIPKGDAPFSSLSGQKGVSMKEEGVTYSGSMEMREDERSKKIIFVCHCLLNSNSKVLERARYSGVHSWIIDTIQQYNLGVVQLPCTEMLHFGSNRYWGGKNVFDSAGYRRFCREQARFIVDYIENYQKVGYKIISIVGCDGSPTCGVNYTNFYKKGGGRPKEIDRELIPGKGIFIEEIEKEVKERNIALPDFYGVGLDIFSSDLDQILSDFRNYLSQKAD